MRDIAVVSLSVFTKCDDINQRLHDGRNKPCCVFFKLYEFCNYHATLKCPSTLSHLHSPYAQVYFWLGSSKHKKSYPSGLPPGFQVTNELMNAERPGLPPPTSIHYTEKHVSSDPKGAVRWDLGCVVSLIGLADHSTKLDREANEHDYQ